MTDQPTKPEQPESQTPPPPPRKRKRGLWWKILLVIFILLIGLVALGPTIASTGAVRSIVVGKINEKINGSVEIADWSLGWFSPIRVSGVKVYDQQKRLILEVPQIKLGISLLGALRSNFKLGDNNEIDIDSFVAEIDPAGKTNLEKLPKSHPAAPKPQPEKSEPTKLPDISGKITVNIRQGTIVDQAHNVSVQVDPSSAVLNISDINKPIATNLKLAYHVGSGATSTVAINGSIGAVKNNVLDLEKLAANQKIDVTNADLSAVSPIAKMQLGGIANGSIEIKGEGLAGLSASGQIVIKDFLADKFKSSTVTIPVNVSQVGPDIIKIENVGVQMNEATLSVTGEISQTALANLAQNKPPGAAGNITVKLDAPDLKKFANLINLQQGVAITGGAVHEEIDVAIAKDSVSVSQSLNASAQGTQNGKPIQIQPITLNASAVAIPNGTSMPDVRDVKVGVNSSFATINGGGESLGKINIAGNLDLAKLRAEAGQFVDLGNIQLQGTGSLNISTDGDVTNANAPITAKATLDFQNLQVSGFASQQVNQDHLTIVASGILNRKDNAPTGIDKAYLGVNSGTLLDLDADATVDLTNNSVPWFELKNCTISNLAQLQQLYGGLVPALAQNKIAITNGAFYANFAGSFDGTLVKLSSPAAVSLPSITVTQDGKPLLNRDTIRASVDGSFAIPKPGEQVALSGLKVQLQSSLANANIDDLKLALGGSVFDMLQSATIVANVPDTGKVYALANSFSPPTTQPLQVTGGNLTLNAKVARQNNGTSISVSDLHIANLALARGKQKYAFPTTAPISFALDAAVQTNGPSIDSISVNKLSGTIPGSLGNIAAITMPKPISVTNLTAATPSANGVIQVQGKIDSITPLLAVIQGGDELPYGGDYNISQSLSTQNNIIAMTGQGNVLGFKVMDAADRSKTLFSEYQIQFANDLSAQLDQKIATIKSLTVDMPQSQAVGVKLSGQIVDWENARQIRGVDGGPMQLVLTYDGDKLWQLLKPSLSTEMQQQYKDLKVEGKFTKTFNVSGSFPAPKVGQDWHASIGSLVADGDLALDMLDLPQGLTIQHFDLPFTMKKGILRTAAAPADASRNLPAANPTTQPTAAKTAICNDGAVNLDEIALDMTKADPFLSIGRKHVLLQGIKLNPVLADSLGHGNLIFKDADEASGVFDLQIIECRDVPLGDLITEKPNAKAQVLFSVTNLHLDGPVPQVMGQVLNLGDQGINGQIKNGSLSLANGMVQSNFAILLAQTRTAKSNQQNMTNMQQTTNLAMTFNGGVNLASGALKDFNVTIPTELIPDRLGGKNIQKALPNGLVVPFTGTTDKFKFDIQGAITKSVGNSLLNGNGGDALQNLGDLIGGGKKKKKSSQ